jgi:hypothetical protein
MSLSKTGSGNKQTSWPELSMWVYSPSRKGHQSELVSELEPLTYHPIQQCMHIENCQELFTPHSPNQTLNWKSG